MIECNQNLTRIEEFFVALSSRIVIAPTDSNL